MISNESIENNFKQNINPYNADNISIIKNPESETNIKDTPDNISIIKNTESEIDIKNTCIILYGRQNKKAKKNIMKIIEFLNADLFLVYENDICNYSKHINLKDRIKIRDIYNNSHPGRVKNQFSKIKKGWIMIEQYEKKREKKYDVVFRMRGDLDYKLNQDIEVKFLKNIVYLNSDFLFYGLREDVKKCFYLYDLWYEFKKKNKINNIKLINVINTIKNNPEKCLNKKQWIFVNKIKAIPVPIFPNKKKNKKKIISILENFNKVHTTYGELIKNKIKLHYSHPKDKKKDFPCELSILLVLIQENIIPTHSKLIQVIKKY